MWLIGTLPLLLGMSSFSSGEVFTAIADMEVLLNTEMALTQSLRSFIKSEEDRIQELKTDIEEYENIYKEASADVTKYLANPINAYVLVKRLTTDLSSIERAMIQNSYPKYMINVTELRKHLKFPTNEDLNGAAVALTRLQDTYKLKTRELADGVLLGKKYSKELTAGDCFELGRQLYNNNDYKHAEPWFRESIKKEAKESKKSVSRQEVMEYLEFTLYKLGNVKESLMLATQILKLSPNNARIKANKDNYEKMIREQRVKDNQRKEFDSDEKELTAGTIEQTTENFENEHYKALCRGEKLMDPKIEGQLKCRYVHKGNHYLKIQPAKEEEAYFNPRIVVYHDVISDSEIATVKRLAQPRFARATVTAVDSGATYPAPFRIAKSSFINDYEHPHIAKISRRVGMISGLDMSVAESLQVVNYGIGGQYEPHNDHSSSDAPNAYSPRGEDWGNRIATWLFYMTDVEAGGATVFPRINVALLPRKGSAALWYNLLPSGEGDERSYHASCPVLTGSKWVCNKWIHERKQLFRRPCRLYPDAEL